MYCSLIHIQFTSSTQIKPSHMAFGRTINILYLLTYLLVLYHHWWCFGGLWNWKAAWVSASPLL